ncbi:hypothetical protein EV645_5991 [Kribbella rubisoli]|uniref:Uncharacterized protein n=1 Tax=Kribbella rubisoli TaxID=3075929 RepID=A0A4V2FWR4_9ACTN|nr:hypothetical protein [Kribbella rubisoli]RZU10836.1 hypothetical protein EV645_5991 [Kribbella rubisoli]
MSFLDLTPTWTDQPLTDPDVAADVVDLMLTLGDRRRGTFAVILCDPDDHYRATITVDLPAEFDRLASPLDTHTLCSTALNPIVPAIQTAPNTAVILALGRPGPARSPALDHAWATAATTICQAAHLRLLTFHIATPEGVYQPLTTPSPTNHPLATPSAA